MTASLHMQNPKQLNYEHFTLFEKVRRTEDQRTMVNEARILLRNLERAASIAPEAEQQRLHVYADYWRDFIFEQTNVQMTVVQPPTVLRSARKIHAKPPDLIIDYDNDTQTRGVFLVPEPAIHGLFWREDMLPELKQRLLSGGDLALYGQAGVGKTMLAQALVRDMEVLQQFPDGVLWAQLNPHSNIMELLKEWATALNLSPLNIAKHRSIKDRSRAIRDKIGLRRMLLIVDNAHNSHDALAFKCGGVYCSHVLTTDFIPVAIAFAQEGVTAVAGLSMKVALDLLRQHAPEWVQLHAEDAPELIKYLDNLPQSIILAGNYLNADPLLSLKELKDKMQGQEQHLLPPVQRQLMAEENEETQFLRLPPLQAFTGLQAGKLSDVEQRALNALCAFPVRPNTFSAEAACYIAGWADTEFEEEQAVTPFQEEPRLAPLTNAGLLAYDPNAGRYALPKEAVDYHKQISLLDTGAAEISRKARIRFVEYFCGFIEHFNPDLHTKQTDVELNNIVSALRMSVELLNVKTLDEPQVKSLQKHLCSGTTALFPYLRMRGLYPLAEELLTKAYAAAECLNDPVVPIRIQLSLAEIAEKFGKNRKAEELLLGCLEQLGSPYDEKTRALRGDLLYALGIVKCNIGEYADAEARLLQGREQAEALAAPPDPLRVSRCLMRLGVVETNWGRFVQAKLYDEEGWKIIEATNSHLDEHLSEIAGHLLNLGVLEDISGNLAAAEVTLRRGWDKALLAQNREKQAGLLHARAEVARKQKAYKDAYTYLQEALQHALEIGHSWYVSLIYKEQGELYYDQEDIQKAMDAFSMALKEAPSRDVAAFAMWGLARIAYSTGKFEEALRLGKTSYNVLCTIRHYKHIDVKNWLAAHFEAGAAESNDRDEDNSLPDTIGAITRHEA